MGLWQSETDALQVSAFTRSHPTEAHSKFGFRDIWFDYKLFSCYPIVLTFYTQHGSVTAVLCEKFQNDLATVMVVIEDRVLQNLDLRWDLGDFIYYNIPLVVIFFYGRRTFVFIPYLDLPFTDGFPHKGPVMRSFNIFFVVKHEQTPCWLIPVVYHIAAMHCHSNLIWRHWGAAARRF